MLLLFNCKRDVLYIHLERKVTFSFSPAKCQSKVLLFSFGLGNKCYIPFLAYPALSKTLTHSNQSITKNCIKLIEIMGTLK